MTRQQAAKLRQKYLDKREKLLQQKVDVLAIKLFDKVFNEYLSQLEQNNGRLVYNNKNISAIVGLNKIFRQFILQDNIPVVRGFINDLKGITPLNETYFKTITNKQTAESAKKAAEEINKLLGVNSKGQIVKDGFTDKFIKDDNLLKKIKKETMKAITQKQGFQQFKENLKRTIEGETGKPLSGGLQQYYRGYAYDTFQKVDRVNAEVFAKDLGLIYFFWAGGKITTSRNMCIHANAKIFNSEQVKKMTFANLRTKPVNYADGITKEWNPLMDLGMWNCRHRKDYISTESALKQKDRWGNVNEFLVIPIK